MEEGRKHLSEQPVATRQPSSASRRNQMDRVRRQSEEP